MIPSPEETSSNVVSLALAGQSLAAIARLKGRSKSSVQRELEKAKAGGVVIPVRVSPSAGLRAKKIAILKHWAAGMSLKDLSGKYGFPEKRISEVIVAAREKGDRRALPVRTKREYVRDKEWKETLAARSLPIAPSIGIRLGRVVKVRMPDRMNVITLSAGDVNWNLLARHFRDEDPILELELLAA
jgi:hypothetical protein